MALHTIEEPDFQDPSVGYEYQVAEHGARFNPADVYFHTNVTEADEENDWSAAVVIDDAFDTHAQGYVQAGFFATHDAVTRDPVTGKLRVDSESIDRAWGPNVLYHVAVNPADINDRATMRKVRMVSSDLHTLPSYDKFEGTLSDTGRAHLGRILESGAELFEIAALAHSAAGSPEGIHEVVRSEVQRAYLADHPALQRSPLHPPEEWGFAIVTSTFDTFVSRWGRHNFTVIGDDVQIDDERVDSQRVALRPTILSPSRFFDNIYRSYTEETSISARRRLAEELVYMTEGIDDQLLPSDVRLARQQMIAAGVVGRKWSTAKKPQPEPSEQVLAGAETVSWEEPTIYNGATDVGRRRLARLERMHWVQRIDEVSSGADETGSFATELFGILHPDQVGGEEVYADFLASRRGFGQDYGNWVYLPWSQQLVHFPPEVDLRRLYTARNQHLVTREEQELLYTKNVFIAGMSVGSEIAAQLLMGGIGGTLAYADPDHLSPTNMGRVRAGFDHVGMSKVDLFARQVSARDPYLKQRQYRQAIDADTLETIPPKDRPDIIFDEVDDLPTKAMIRAYAAKYRIPVVMITDLGTASVIDIERYDLDENTKPFGGRLNPAEFASLLAGEASVEQIQEYRVRMFSELLATQPRLVASLRDLESHVLGGGIPQLGSTAALGGSIGATVARAILLGRELPAGRAIIDPERILALPVQNLGRAAINAS